MSDALIQLKQQAVQARTDVESWRQEQRRGVSSEAEEMRKEQRETGGDVEREAQARINIIKRAEARAKRARELTGKRAATKQYKEATKQVEEERKAGLSAMRANLKSIEKAEIAAIAEVEKVAAEAKNEIDKQEEKGVAEYAAFMADKVELDTGELVDKVFYQSLAADKQKLLKEHGIDTYNAAVEDENKMAEQAQAQAEAQFKRDNVETGLNGEYISREAYDAMSDDEKDYIKYHSVAEYNKHYRNQAAKQSYAQYVALAGGADKASISLNEWKVAKPEAKQAVFEGLLKNYTETAKGELIPNSQLMGMDAEAQEVLLTQGVDGLNDWVKERQAEFEAKWVKAGDQYVDREWANSLPTTERDYLLTNGLDAYMGQYYTTTLGGDTVRKDIVDKLPAEYINMGSEKYKQWIDTNFVRCDNGDYIALADYEKIPNEWKASVKMGGIKAYENAQKAYIANNYVALDTGELVGKDEFAAMSKDDQALLKKAGTIGYNMMQSALWEAWVKDQPEAVQAWIAKTPKEDVLKWYARSATASDVEAFGILKGMGYFDKGDQFEGRTEDGSFIYSKGDLTNPYSVNLDNVDVSKVTQDDIASLYNAAWLDTRYRVGKSKTLSNAVWWGDTQRSFDKWLKTLPPNEAATLKKVAAQAAMTRLNNAVAVVLPPIKGLKPDVYPNDPRNDVSITDWAIGTATTALAVVGGLGVLAKAGTAAAKTVSVASRVVNAGAITTFGVTTAAEWAKMSSTEKILNVALNVAFAGAMCGKSAIKGLSAFMRATDTAEGRILSQVGAKMKAVANGVRGSSAPSIRKAAAELEELGNKLITTRPMAARKLQEQARYIHRNADRLATGMATPKSISARIRSLDLNVKKVATMTEKGVAGGTTPLTPAEQKALKGYSKEVQEAAKAQSDRVVAERARIREEVLHPTGTVVRQMKVSPAMPDWMKRNIGSFEPSVVTIKPQEAHVKAKIPPVTQESTELANKVQQEMLHKQRIEQITEQIEKTAQFKLELAKRVELWLQIKQKLILERAAQIARREDLARIDESLASVEKVLKAELEAVAANTHSAKISPNKFITRLLEANMVTVAIASNAMAMGKILVAASPSTQQKALSQLSPELAAATKRMIDAKVGESASSAAARAQAIATLNNAKAIASDLAALATSEIQATTKPYSDTKTSALTTTSTDTKTQAEVATQTGTKTSTRTNVNVDTFADTKLDTKTATKTYTMTDTEAETEVETRTKSAEILQSKVTRIIDPDKFNWRRYWPIRVKLTDGSEHDLTKKELLGSVGWKQGLFYILIWPPYGDKNCTYTREPIPGIPYHSGLGSAYKTLRRLGGKLPPRIEKSMGAFLAEVFTESGKEPRLVFRQERHVVRLPNGREHDMTEGEIAGSAGWKQGMFYVVVFPPYGDNDVGYSKEPIDGVKYEDGAGSAYKTLARIGGRLPPSIMRDMGAFSAEVMTKGREEPRLVFGRKHKKSNKKSKRRGQSVWLAGLV